MRRLAPTLALTALVVAACSDDGPPTGPPDTPESPSPQVVELTPFQESIHTQVT